MGRVSRSIVLLVFASAALLPHGCGRPELGARPQASGHWEARLAPRLGAKRVLLHLERSFDGRYRGAADFPDDHVRNVALERIVQDGRRLHFEAQQTAAIFDGELADDGGSLTGVWRQPDFTLRLEFRRVDSLFSRAGPSTYEPPAALEDGWEVSTLAAEGVQAAPILEMLEKMRTGELPRLDSLLITRNGKLVFEDYGSLYYGRDQLHNLESVTKSVLSTLTGIALEHGDLTSLDRPVLSYLKRDRGIENWDERKRKISLEHLLTMRTGLDCDNQDERSFGHPTRMARHGDWTSFVLGLPQLRDPGERFSYCEGSAQLLSAVLEASSKQPLASFAATRLFAPLGIDESLWRKVGGQYEAAAGLALRPRDMAKIGQLYANGGNWRGETIVSRAWIEQALSQRTEAQPFGAYGYMWWTERFRLGDRQIEAASAIGSGGQRVVVLRELGVVIAMTASEYEGNEIYEDERRILERHILPALLAPAAPLAGADSTILSRLGGPWSPSIPRFLAPRLRASNVGDPAADQIRHP